jgi:hypothetical protein
MKLTIRMIASTIVLLVVVALGAFAQGAQQWNVGDKVEILNLSKDWVPGTVIGTVDWGGKLMYRVQLDDPNASTVYFNHTPVSDIRRRGGQIKIAPPPPPPPVRDAEPAPMADLPNGGGKFDIYYNATQGKNRGTIIGAQGNKYKIHYPGCTQAWDEWVDRSLVRDPATVTPDADIIMFLYGKWTLTKVGMSSSNIAWGKAEGIEIGETGNFVWYQGGGKAPVKGRWETDAKVPGTDSGTQFYDGILVKDADGREWKVFKWVVKGYPDGVEVQRMCSGETIVGSRSH